MIVKIHYLVVVLFAGLVDNISAQRAPPYVEPLWYPRMEAEDETGLLHRCMRRTRKDSPPKDGDPCARRPKMCYFGTQDCDGVGAHPEIMCVCDGRDGTMKWLCEESVSCPPARETGCPAPCQEGDPRNSVFCPDEEPAFGENCPIELQGFDIPSAPQCLYQLNSW